MLNFLLNYGYIFVLGASALFLFFDFCKKRYTRSLKKKAVFPPCRDWNLWAGKEIEGREGLGKETLFVRHLSDPDEFVRTYFLQFERVWFCKEFRDWGVVRDSFGAFKTVCVEATLEEHIPWDVKNRAIIYLKINGSLKKGDYVCVGPSFADESFEIGKGRKVSPNMYCADRRIA